MMNKSRKLLLTLLLSCSVVMIATGCDQLKKETQTEAVTEAPTEAPTESETQTEVQTEPPTESETQTESETEPPAESETQPQNLTVEEELAQETEYDQLRTLYAADDVNVRVQPGTGDDVEVFDSFDQGEQVTVVGETPNWYKVDVDGYEDNGYVSRQFMSESEVAPKTEEERAQIAAGETVTDGGTSTDGTATETGTATASADTGSTATDSEYGVESYAESFPIVATAGANMRSTPAQDGEILNTIASGTSVTAVGYTDRWYKISYDGTVGYVNKNLFATE